VRELMGRIARSGRPCLAIMNMPPLPFLARIPGSRPSRSRPATPTPRCGGDSTRAITLASPDPQAFRPPEQPKNVLHVGLPTNFKVARFEDAAHTALLRELEADIEAARLVLGARRSRSR
jgi:hypothetical protein